MKYLLHGYYIDYHSENKAKLCVLCLLHELRVISRTQLLDLLNLEISFRSSSLTKVLRYLKANNLIDKKKNGKEVYYFLTKEGHLSIGGFYVIFYYFILLFLLLLYLVWLAALGMFSSPTV